MSPKVIIIIPSYNETLHIDAFFSNLKSHTKDLVSAFVLIDDGSKDDTKSIAEYHTPHVLSHVTNLGKGAALKTGCEYAFNSLKADYVIMMDADEQHASSDLPLFFDQIKKNHDIILGVRSFKGMPLIPTLFNRFASFLIQVIYGVYVPDIPSGFKAISKNGYDKVKWNASGYEVEIEIAQKIAQKKLPFVTVPIQTIYPDYVRGMTLLDGVKVLLKLMGIR